MDKDDVIRFFRSYFKPDFYYSASYEEKMSKLDSTSNKIAFYEALKNSQPFAILASLSIIIASLFQKPDEVTTIFSHALLAGVMFLSAFICSFIGQLTNSDDKFSLFGISKIFFLALGFLYWALIIVDFIPALPQIAVIFAGWILIVIGLTILLDIIFKRKSFRRYEKTTKLEIATIVSGVVFSVSFIIAGSIIAANAFIPNNIDYIALLGFEVGGLFLIITAILVTINDHRRGK